MKNLLTAARLQEVLNYNCESGVFTWRLTIGSRAKVGNIAGGKDSYGYWCIKLDGTTHKGHRLAWLYVHGHFPKNLIDHRDGDVGNNAILNLRDATTFINQQNQRHPHSANKTSNLLGVSKGASRKKYISQINFDGKPQHLGCFTTAEAAHAAYLSAKRLLHPGCTI